MQYPVCYTKNDGYKERCFFHVFKCGEFPNATSWEFLAYIVTAGAQTLPSECADVMCFYHFCCRTILWRRLFIGQDFCTSEGHHISWAKGLRVREREEHRLAPDSNYNFCLWKYRGCCENKKERVSQVVFHFSLDRNSNIREFPYKYSIESRRPENSSNKRGI